MLYRNKTHFIDIFEGTYQLFKIEAKDFLNPLKLTFRYLDDDQKELKLIYSRTNTKPEERSCERVVVNPTVLLIKALNQKKFVYEYIYIKFQSENGCQFTVKVAYPN